MRVLRTVTGLNCTDQTHLESPASAQDLHLCSGLGCITLYDLSQLVIDLLKHIFFKHFTMFWPFLFFFLSIEVVEEMHYLPSMKWVEDKRQVGCPRWGKATDSILFSDEFPIKLDGGWLRCYIGLTSYINYKCFNLNEFLISSQTVMLDMLSLEYLKASLHLLPLTYGT